MPATTGDMGVLPGTFPPSCNASRGGGRQREREGRPEVCPNPLSERFGVDARDARGSGRGARETLRFSVNEPSAETEARSEQPCAAPSPLLSQYFVSSGFAFIRRSSTDICAVEAVPLEQLDGEAVKKGWRITGGSWSTLRTSTRRLRRRLASRYAAP